jgi:hypothetical protein
VVEHSLGKGEVESSILSGSTIPKPLWRKGFALRSLHCITTPKRQFTAERGKNMLRRYVENPGSNLVALSAPCRSLLGGRYEDLPFAQFIDFILTAQSTDLAPLWAAHGLHGRNQGTCHDS